MYETLNELVPDYLQWDSHSTLIYTSELILCSHIYLQRLFTQRHVNDYNLLRNLEGKLWLPKSNNNYLKRSSCYSEACLWNNLPQDLKSVGSIEQFKRGIKKLSEISDPHAAIM